MTAFGRPTCTDQRRTGRKHLFDLAFDRPLVGLRGHRRQQPRCEGAARL